MQGFRLSRSVMVLKALRSGTQGITIYYDLSSKPGKGILANRYIHSNLSLFSFILGGPPTTLADCDK